MSNEKWECEIIAPPELHKPIQELFDAISWKLKHAESSSTQFATDIYVGNMIYRRQAIDEVQHIGRLASLADGDSVIRVSAVKHVLHNLPSAQTERKKGKWLVDEDGNMECPFCGNTCGFGNYCNECGADLRGE